MIHSHYDRVLPKLQLVIEDTKQAAREIYYAMSFIDEHNPGIVNLGIALKLLGVGSPKDVGLSERVLIKDKDK